MLKVDELEKLEVGDQIELPGLFPGLTPEPVVLRVTLVERGGLTAEGRYFGVHLGCWTARSKSGLVEWRRQKPVSPAPGSRAPGSEATR